MSSAAFRRDRDGADDRPPERFLCATLIGDIVASRQLEPELLSEALRVSLTFVNDQISPLRPLGPTLGDEFQGCFARVPEAVLASTIIRLVLATGEPALDARFGLGWGTITVFGGPGTPIEQNGPGWWTARDAIDHIHGLGEKRRTPFARGWYVPDERRGPERQLASGINAFLLTRDALIARMNSRQQRLLLGVLLGRDHADLADQEGIARATVTQNLTATGAYAIVAGHETLAGESV